MVTMPTYWRVNYKVHVCTIEFVRMCDRLNSSQKQNNMEDDNNNNN